MARPVKKPVKSASSATLEEIADAIAEAERRAAWKKEKKEGERRCDLCGTPFKPNRSWQTYCSNSCRVGAFQSKVANSELKLLGRIQELEKEKEDLTKRVKELESAIQRT